MSKLVDLKEVSSQFTVLYVEDDIDIANSFLIYLKKLFKKVDYFPNGQEALDSYTQFKQDIVITDIQMPIMDGLEMSSKIKEINEEQNILITSAYSDSEKFIKSIKIGVDGYILKPIDYEDLNNLLYKIVTKIKKFREHSTYEKNLKNLVKEKTYENQQLNYEKIDNYEKTLYALIDIIESRDTYTGKHSLRVAKYSKLIAKELGLSHDDCEEIYKAGILHDIGKIAIPDSLLLKPSKLDENEYNLVKEHVNIGYHMLEQIPMFQDISKTIQCHHERLDGSGYPNALRDDEIPLKANIMAVADSFDAMTTNRIYKGRHSVYEALKELESLSDIHFKKEIVNAAIKVLKDIEIDNTINQLPHTTLEEERFAYFYKDNLTELFNEKYLDFILSKNRFEDEFSKLNIILIKNFSDYNSKNGWSEGNKLLVKISKKLMQIYSGSIIFRIHGDDFIILNSLNYFDEKAEQHLQQYITEFSEELIIVSKEFDIVDNNITSTRQLEKLL